MFMYMYSVLLCTFCFHRANWHYSATLTEVFRAFFLSCKANARVSLAKDGARPALFPISAIILGSNPRKPSNQSSELCCSMYRLCVNVYCVKWQWQVLQPAFTWCTNTLTNNQTTKLDTEDNSRYGTKV
jgi:hypothetical protein